MPIRIFVFLLAQMVVFSHARAEDFKLRYDGVYVGAPFDDDKEYCAYLRFYPPGDPLVPPSALRNSGGSLPGRCGGHS